MATAVPVLWTYDDSALEEAAVALTRLRTAPPAFCPGPRKTSRGGSGNSARSGEALSPTTPALADDGSDPAPAPEALEVPGSTEEESDAEDESPRHADGADAEIAQAYGRSRSWTREEDEQVRRLVAEHGLRKWALIASCLGTKSQKQVYARYRDYLAPQLVDSVWTPDEHSRLFELHAELGNRWSEIAKRMPGVLLPQQSWRSPNAIKNRFNACLRKKQRHANRGHDMEMS